MVDPADRLHPTDDIGRIVREIRRYLHAHPHAADTVEGINRWWLAPVFGTVSIEALEQALAVLIQRGVVQRAPLGDGRFVYRSSLDSEA